MSVNINYLSVGDIIASKFIVIELLEIKDDTYLVKIIATTSTGPTIIEKVGEEFLNSWSTMDYWLRFYNAIVLWNINDKKGIVNPIHYNNIPTDIVNPIHYNDVPTDIDELWRKTKNFIKGS